MGNGDTSVCAISADRKNVVIGSPLNDENGKDSGLVQVYAYAEAQWNQVGMDIKGESNGDQYGYAVSISWSGMTIAIGAMYNDGNGFDNSGHVRAYSYDELNGIK